MEKFTVDEKGYYGDFGGAYVPEILHGCVEQLRRSYIEILESEDFVREYTSLLRDYAGRPSPLYHAARMSKRYGCKIYLKREDLNHTGAHKINNALRNLPCVVYMGETDVERQHLNVEKMKMLGATVVPVTSGNRTLKDATNEAIRDWCCHPDDTHYVIGSTVGPHPYPDMVARLQSVISAEIMHQLREHEGRTAPDYLVACVGGGSNAAGTIYHYLDNPDVKIILAEAGGKGIDTPYSAATISLGRPGVLHGSYSLVMQDADGQIIEPYSISAGLDYPGIGPMHANLARKHRATVMAINDDEALEAAMLLTKTEGIIPALESSHALAALEKVDFKPSDVVVVTVSGRGDKDMETYLKYMNGVGADNTSPKKESPKRKSKK